MKYLIGRLCLLLSIVAFTPMAHAAEASFTAAGNTTATVSVQLCYAVQVQGTWTGDIVLERQSPTAATATAWGTVRTFTSNFEGQGAESGEAFNYRLRAGSTFSGTANVRLNTVVTSCRPGDFNVSQLSVVAVSQTSDPCQSPGVAKSSVVIANTIDAELLAVSGSTVIYVCGYNFTLNGTTPTARFITGTGAICATGTVNETGIHAPTVGLNLLTAGGGYTVFSGAAGAALCIDVGGTTPSAQGVLTYVRQ